MENIQYFTSGVLTAFLVGGFICAAVQLIIDKTALTPARILVGLVVLGVILGALGIYEPFSDFAGAGATVPLSGFGCLLSKGVRHAVAEHGLCGVLTGGITAAAGGITAAIFFSFVTAIFSRSREK